MNAVLIRNAEVYAPERLGVQDVLMVNGRFAAVGKDLNVVMPGLETIDAAGKLLTPGFFDQHIHVTGRRRGVHMDVYEQLPLSSDHDER